jgi:hypothetical protein
VSTVAVAVVVATTVSTATLGVVSELRRPGPTVAGSSGQLPADVAGSSDQRVRTTHEAGDLDPATVERLANTDVLRYRYRSSVESSWR